MDRIQQDQMQQVLTLSKQPFTNLRSVDEDGRTILYYITDPEAFRVGVLKRGTNINAIDLYGNTLLDFKIDRSELENVNILLDLNAHVSARTLHIIRSSPLYFSWLVHLLRFPFITSEDMRDWMGVFVIDAVHNDQGFDYIEWLLSHPVNVDMRDSHDWTAMFHAVVKNELTVLNVLHRAGYDINARDLNGNTPLMVAARQGSYAVVRWCIRHGADDTIRNIMGQRASDVDTSGFFRARVRLLSNRLPDRDAVRVVQRFM